MRRSTERAEVSITYDPEADAIDLGKPAGRVETQEVQKDYYADYDSRGRLVGFEILNASKHYQDYSLSSLPSPVEWLTLAEAAKESGLSPGTLRVQINAGRLRGREARSRLAGGRPRALELP